MKLKFLVVGYGSMGARHAKNLKKILKRKEDIIVCRQPGQDKAPYFETFFNLNKALAKKPTAVIIATPPSSHMPIALKCANQGCHLFIEKPLANNLKGAVELTALAKRKKLKVMLGCNFRFHPGLKRLKRLIEKKRVGKIISIIVQVGQYLPDWRPNKKYQEIYSAQKSLGGGVVLDLIHELDSLYWLCGKPKTVFAFCDKLSNLKIDVEDTADILLKFKNKIQANIHLDYVQRQAQRRYQIIGEKRTISWDYFRHPNRNKMYLDEMRHFVQCVRKQKRPLIDLEQGMEVLKIALAVKESSLRGKAINIK